MYIIFFFFEDKRNFVFNFIKHEIQKGGNFEYIEWIWFYYYCILLLELLRLKLNFENRIFLFIQFEFDIVIIVSFKGNFYISRKIQKRFVCKDDNFEYPILLYII